MQAHPLSHSAKPIQATPFHTVTNYHSVPPPAVSLCDWEFSGLKDRDGNRLYRPAPRLLQAWLPLSEAAALPFGLSGDTLKRLGDGGFIEICRPTPAMIRVNVSSLIEHLDACEADPHFWKREGNHDRWRDARTGPDPD